MANTMMKLFALMFGIGLIVMGLAFFVSIAKSAEKPYEGLEGRAVIVKFLEDGLVLTSVDILDLGNLRVHMIRESGEELYYRPEPEKFNKLDIYRYDYPYNDLEVVIVEYYEENHEGGAQWVPYFLRNYHFAGEG